MILTLVSKTGAKQRLEFDRNPEMLRVPVRLSKTEWTAKEYARDIDICTEYREMED